MRPPATARIICVGNRYQAGDGAGPEVHDRLLRQGLPDGVDLIDGGLLGLSLLPLVDGARRVVFVDQVEGFGSPGEVVVLRQDELLAGDPPQFGHADGLRFLLRAIPLVTVGQSPELALVGIEGAAVTESAVAAAAARALDLALGTWVEP